MFVGYLANMGLTLALIYGNDRIGYDVDLDIIFLNGSDPNPFTLFSTTSQCAALHSQFPWKVQVCRTHWASRIDPLNVRWW